MADSKKPIQKLVKKAKAGDAQAFGEIYNRLLGKIYRFVIFRVGRQEDAEDITEEVFLRAWQNLPSFRETGSPFEAWLFRICRNAVIDYYRTKKPMITIDAVSNVIADQHPAPDEVIDHNMQMAQILNTLRKIKGSYQEIIILKFIEDKNNQEISAILQKPQDQIRVLQSRALKALRKALKDQKS